MTNRSVSLFFLFIVLSIALSGCGGPIDNGNLTNIAPPSSPAANDVSYPALASGLANADIENLDGSKFKVSDKKGKVVLLNIWGTWCGPCRAEMPTLMALQDKYRDKGFEVLGLNIGDGEGVPETNDQITKFVEMMKLNYQVARISNATTREFNTVTGGGGVVPQTILVDRQGRLRGVFVGGGPRVYASMEDTIEKVMSE